jgi:hypothetical protein
VVGYSGRDDSVMDALNEALDESGAFPLGLFWLHRGDAAPLPRVSALIAKARAKGVETGLVQIENFDETLRDLVRLVGEIETTCLDQFAQERRRWTPAPIPGGRRGWPVVRLNAVPLVEAPSVCRRVACGIGGYREIREAVDRAGTDIIFARTAAGVLAFGADADIRATLGPYGITTFDLHTIESRRLRYDSSERGLLRDALTRALARGRCLSAVRRRSADLLRPENSADARWAELGRLVGALSGTVDRASDLLWYEGVSIRLDWANDRLWLLIEPRTIFEGLDQTNKALATDFARERTVKRYNRQLNDLISFWSSALAGDGSPIEALGSGEGVDAVFKLAPQTAYSRRSQA